MTDVQQAIRRYVPFWISLLVGIALWEAAGRSTSAAFMAKLKEATEKIGYPVLPVVQQLVKLCKDGLGEWSHWGATTQDITDTATIMGLLYRRSD